MKREKNDQQPNTKEKSTTGWVRFFLSLALIVIAIFVIFNYVPFVAKYDYYRILTGSMNPVIKVNEVVVIDTSVDHNELKSGDIIAFYADINNDGTDEIIVHYLDSITTENGITTYETRHEIQPGETGDGTDNWQSPITDDDIVGIHVLTLPKFFGFMTSTVGKIILIVDVVIIYVIVEMFTNDKKKKIQEPDVPEEKQKVE